MCGIWIGRGGRKTGAGSDRGARQVACPGCLVEETGGPGKAAGF